MKGIFLGIKNFIIGNFETILLISEWILIIGFIGICFFLTLIILLQRGEEGIFAKTTGDKITTNSNTLMRVTIVLSISMFGIAMILNGIIYHQKHASVQKTYNEVVNKNIKEK